MYGHTAGDTVLSQVEQVIFDQLHKGDIAGRFGGDEYTLLIDGVSDYKTLQERLTNLQENIQSLNIEREFLRTSCSIGSVYTCGQYCVFDTLFNQADSALYQAKKKRKRPLHYKSLYGIY